jgi:hypothetical protein
MRKCINLKEQFGKRYKVVFEESDGEEKPEFRAAEAPWLMLIPCDRGHIYPVGGTKLAAFLEPGPRAKQLGRLPRVKVYTDGDDGITVRFDVSDLPKIAKVMHARRRSQRKYTEEEKQALRDRLPAANAAKKLGLHARGDASESTFASPVVSQAMESEIGEPAADRKPARWKLEVGPEVSY